MIGARNHYGLTRVGTPRMEGKMGRKCKRCQAAPGHRCGRWTGFERSIWEPIDTPHRER